MKNKITHLARLLLHREKKLGQCAESSVFRQAYLLKRRFR